MEPILETKSISHPTRSATNRPSEGEVENITLGEFGIRDSVTTPSVSSDNNPSGTPLASIITMSISKLIKKLKLRTSPYGDKITPGT